MVVDNFKKSITGLNKADHDSIPIPYNGDTGTGKEQTNAINAWRIIYSGYFLHQAPFAILTNFNSNNSNYPRSATAYGYGLQIAQNLSLFGETGAYQCWFVDVGFGFDVEDKTDYKLADSNWYDGTRLTHKYGQVVLPTDAETDTIIKVESVYENTGSTDVTVTELGLVSKVPKSTQYQNVGAVAAKYCNYLVARTLLETPIVVHPGEVYKFVYKLKL